MVLFASLIGAIVAVFEQNIKSCSNSARAVNQIIKFGLVAFSLASLPAQARMANAAVNSKADSDLIIHNDSKILVASANLLNSNQKHLKIKPTVSASTPFVDEMTQEFLAMNDAEATSHVSVKSAPQTEKKESKDLEIDRNDRLSEWSDFKAGEESIETPTLRGYHLGYRLGTQFASYSNEREQMQGAGLKAELELRKRFFTRLLLTSRAGAVFDSNYAQSRFGEFAPSSAVYLREAALSFRALDEEAVRLIIAGGAIDQGQVGSRLLVDEQAFPSLMQLLMFGSNDLYLKIWSQQAIPTSKTLSTKSVDSEVMPTFTTETVEVGAKPYELVSGKLQMTHWAFQNLPSSVAVDSAAFGNTTRELGPNSEQFKYAFDGILMAGEFELGFTPRFKLGTRAQVLQNTAAPEGSRNGQILTGYMKLGMSGDVELTPEGGTFFLESDASPAFYNDAKLGHNNRQGFIASVEANFKSSGFKIKAEYVDAALINPSTEQTRQQYLRTKLETAVDWL